MTGDDFNLVLYQRTDRAAVFQFLREALPPADGERLIRQWDWKYDTNPFNRGGEPFIRLMTHGERIAGITGNIFLRCVINGDERLACHNCDLVVHPAYRGQHLPARMRRPEQDRPFVFSWQNERTFSVARHNRTQGVPFVSVVKPLDVARVVRRLTGERLIGRVAAATAGGVHRCLPRLPGHRRPTDVTVAALDRFDARFDRLWQRSRCLHPVMIVRDQRYLTWRFQQRSDAQYRIWAACRHDEVLGYMITRCVDRAGESWGYLVDYLVVDRSPVLFGFLVDRAVADLREAGAAAVSCRAVVPPYRGMLYRRGFVRSWWETPGYFRTRLDLPDPPLQAYGDARQWFTTMGDGDLELSI